MKLLDRSQLTSAAIHLIDDGGSAVRPTAGDVWVLADDGQDLALGLISRVHDSFVCVLPITLDPSEAREPASIVRADDSPIGQDIAVWSPAPTGIGMHLLDRRVGTLCSGGEALQLERSAFDNDVESPYEMGAEIDSNGTTPFIDFLFQSFRTFCFNTWPAATAGEAVFRTSKLEEAGLNAKELRSILKIAARGDAAQLFHGQTMPTTEQLSTVAELTGVNEADLVTPCSAELVTELVQPVHKSKVVALAERRNLKQRQARNLLLQNSLLAARSGSAPKRVEEAFARLMED